MKQHDLAIEEIWGFTKRAAALQLYSKVSHKNLHCSGPNYATLFESSNKTMPREVEKACTVPVALETKLTISNFTDRSDIWTT